MQPLRLSWQDRIEDVTELGLAGPPRVRGGREQRPEEVPLGIGQVARMGSVLIPFLRTNRHFGTDCYWRHATNRPDGRIRAFDLIQWPQGVQEGRPVDASITPLVHEVREYRNFLVHGRNNPAPPVPIRDARTRLSTHLSKLPDQRPSVGDDE